MLIVDAFNVLHTTGVLPPDLADPGVPGLIRLIARSRYATRDLTIVCDGGGSGDSGVRMDRARVLYSGASREADDLIEELIERFHRGNPLEVVSSDARLRRAARRRRCGCIPSATFLSRLADDARRPISAVAPSVLRESVPLDAYSVDGWLREFGLPPAERTPKPTAGTETHGDPPSTAGPTASHGPAAGAPPQPDRPKRKRRGIPPTPPASLGERLSIRIPGPTEAEPAIPSAVPSATPSAPPPAAPDGPRADRTDPPRTDASDPPPTTDSPSPAPGLETVDPLLLRALEEWRDRLTIDDLDMQKWTPDATPLPTTRRKGNPPRRRPPA